MHKTVQSKSKKNNDCKMSFMTTFGASRTVGLCEKCVDVGLSSSCLKITVLILVRYVRKLLVI